MQQTLVRSDCDRLGKCPKVREKIECDGRYTIRAIQNTKAINVTGDKNSLFRSISNQIEIGNKTWLTKHCRMPKVANGSVSTKNELSCIFFSDGFFLFTVFVNTFEKLYSTHYISYKTRES